MGAGASVELETVVPQPLVVKPNRLSLANAAAIAFSRSLPIDARLLRIDWGRAAAI